MKKILFLSLSLLIISSLMYTQEINLKLQSKLLLKIISYDKNFSRFGDPIKIGVSSEGMVSALNANKLKIKGKGFVAEKMDSPADISKYKIVYVDKNWASNYSAVSSKAVENKCLVFAGDPSFVESGGGTVSFKLVKKKPKILVNLKNSKAQGTDFSSGFLKVTIIIN